MDNSFKDIPLKISYDSGKDDILWDFYIPVLSMAESYDRIAGFFSSTSLALCARGLEKFICNGGKMRLVTCPKLSAKDIEMIEKSVNNVDEIITQNFIEDYSQIEEEFEKDHVKALGWMLANNKLEIKIAIMKEDGVICSQEQITNKGIMHQKVGILRDSKGNTISFSGSNNESAYGWLGNTEEFKVFSGWKGIAAEYVKEDEEKFLSFWENKRRDVEIKNIPQALREHLIYESKDFEPNHLSTKRYYKKINKKEKEELKLFYYQKSAVDKWEENNRSLLLQMATGCGKTRTAIACMDKVLKDTNKLLIIIACPQVTLTSQWKKDVDKLRVTKHNSIEINGNTREWKVLLKREVSKVLAGRYKNLVVYTTHKIISKDDFINIIKDNRLKKFLIADEVHGIGSKENKKGLIEEYDYRLGLSATPQRWFDDYGSKIIEEYFGNQSFEFSIHDALINRNPLTNKPFLVNYEYDPRFISLTQDELEYYTKLTNKIKKMSKCKKDSEIYEYLQFIRFQRATIEKNAENKYEELSRLLDEIGNDISDTIIFVSDKQIDKVVKILGDRNISTTKFTQEQGTIPSEEYGGISERDYIIKKFKQKKYQVLVAIKCLDEGIDIPSANRAIIMASSTNPREYVQRIGRIIRQAPGKYKATIHDMIIKPDLSMFYDEILQEMELKIFRKEMDRVLELSENALNNTSIVETVFRVLQEV